jgi:exonuclease VII large subunit
LNSLSYKNVLRRGYSVVKIDRKIIKHDNEISKNDRIEIEFFNSKTSVRKI